MTKTCSELTCLDEAVKEITIRGHSFLTDRDYKMDIFVCPKHYKLEKAEIKTFVSERALHSFRSGK